MQAYDQIVSALGGAIRAIRDRDIEKKTKELNHALALISHLQRDLDFKAGGEVARVMDRFYTVARTQILEASVRLSPEILQQTITQFASQREAWEQVERANSTTGAVSDKASPDPTGRETPTPQSSARWSA
jgi:flagellar biosynthetic protein FliS